MATIVIKTIKPSGGDYTSLSAWEAGEQRDLVTLNEIAVAECYSMQDTTAVTINGFTTDAAHYVEIRTPLSERHNGKWDAAKYNLTVVDADALVLSDDHVRVIGLQIRVSSTVYGRNAIYISFPGISEFHLADNILDGQLNTLTTSGISTGTSATSALIKAWNNIIYGFHRGWNGGIEIPSSGAGSYAYNNTVYDCQYGFKISTTNFELKNNLGAANNRTNFTGTPAAASDYNASDDATSTGGANDRVSQTFTFVDAVNRDLHLAATDTGARDFGADLSATFTDDIEGQLRTAPWDIGADEYVAGGGSIPVSGNTIGSSAYYGALIRDLVVGGTAASVSSVAGLAGLGSSAAGTIAGVSFQSASALMQRTLSGTLNGVSLFSGAVTTTALTALAGSIKAISAFNGKAGLIRLVSGPIAGVSILSASSGVFRSLQGAVSGVSFLTAAITGRPANYISGQVDVLSTFAGGVAMGYGLHGSSLSVLLSGGDIHETISCGGSFSGVFSMTGAPVLIGKLSPASLAGSPRFDVSRYGGGGAPIVQADSEKATVTQDNNNPRVTR